MTICQIARSHSLRHNYVFVRLLTIQISQWAHENFCSYCKNRYKRLSRHKEQDNAL